MSATITQAVANTTAKFRKTDYGYTACTQADAALARTFLPEALSQKNGNVHFGHQMLPAFEALAKAAGIRIEIVSQGRLI